MEISNYIHEQIKDALDYRLLRHPVIWIAGALFFLSIIFFALGTIKFQSLAIDIDKQGKEALERSISHIKLVSDDAKSSINKAKQISLRNISIAENTEVESLKAKALPIISNGLKLIKSESEKAIVLIQSEGERAISNRIEELQIEVDKLESTLKNANQKIKQLEQNKVKIDESKYEIEQLLNDWESIKKQGNSWEESLIRSIDNWRVLLIELLFVGLISLLLSYILIKRKSN